MVAPKIFISYSHDTQEHKDWVLNLATRLRKNGVDAILDIWNLDLGSNIAQFIEEGLSKAHRVICICSEEYIRKANQAMKGAGYEKTIMTADLLENSNTEWIIPLIKKNDSVQKLPTFLKGKKYINFENDELYEEKYEELLRDLLDEPLLPLPPLGKNPFQNIKAYENQKFTPSNEKYYSASISGQVTFDYSNNNGIYCIGSGDLMFELAFSKSSNVNIQLYNDPKSIKTIAIVKDTENIFSIYDARNYDGSSRVRRPNINQIAIIQNINGYFSAIKILSIKDDTRGHDRDEVVFDYIIQSNGSPNFVTCKQL